MICVRVSPVLPGTVKGQIDEHLGYQKLSFDPELPDRQCYTTVVVVSFKRNRCRIWARLTIFPPGSWLMILEFMVLNAMDSPCGSDVPRVLRRALPLSLDYENNESLLELGSL